MRPRLRVVLKWLLIVPVLAVSSVIAALALEFSVLLDRALLAELARAGSKILPTMFLNPLHQFVLLATLLLITLPTAFTVAFALHVRPRAAVPWAFSLAVLLLGISIWFLSPHQANQVISRCCVIFASLVISVGILTHFLQAKTHNFPLVACSVATVALFVPSGVAFATATKGPPEAEKVWTAVLQQQTWQGMNTGSEYAATRQLVLAGGRVVAVFDSGITGYKDSKVGGSQGKWALSNYRVVSLDLATGEKKDELDLTGRWGSMPYIYPLEDGHVVLQSNPPRILNVDLTDAGDGVNHYHKGPSQKELTDLSKLNTCEFDPSNPFERTFGGCETIKIVDRNGRVQAQQPVVPGRFAGSSRDGSRFAIQSSDSEGDPSFLLYEYFTIYDGHTALPIASVRTTDLPERQSWSAFSPDGKFFAVGNPSNLSLFRVL